MLNIKKCPICGHRVELENTRNGILDDFHISTYRLRCFNCGLTFSGGTTVKYKYSPNTGVVVDESDLERYIKRWNERVSTDAAN